MHSYNYMMRKSAVFVLFILLVSRIWFMRGAMVLLVQQEKQVKRQRTYYIWKSSYSWWYEHRWGEKRV